ncbi:MAG: hypothetical protein KF850_26365 [Labilithrix sp.]|nr:hypothetical protein [Labilithrix sp.]
MLCSFRLYVRPNRAAAPPPRPAVVKHDPGGAPAPAPAPALVVDTPPHVALVRQYAW